MTPAAKAPDAVMRTVAEALLARLSGFRGYPRESSGRLPFVEALEKCASVEHARSTIDAFDEDFPTLKEFRDQIHNLRPKFNDADERDQWPDDDARDEEGRRSPEAMARLRKLQREEYSQMLAAIEVNQDEILNRARARHERYTFLWQKARRHLGLGSNVSMPAYKAAQALRSLGFPETDYDRELIEAWEGRS